MYLANNDFMEYNAFGDIKVGLVLSVGDKIPCKRFGRIHSRFEQVLNFYLGELIVSIVTPQISAGPFRIILDNVDLKTISEAKLTLDDLYINHSTVLSRSTARAYNSNWKNSKEINILPKNMRNLRNLLFTSENEKALMHLLQPNQIQSDISAYEKELISQLRSAQAKFKSDDIVNAVKGFKGRGYGLTPAGDDFNIGLLMGLTIRQKCEKTDFSKTRSLVYTNALGNNPMINTFLLQVYHGWFNDDWKRLFSALMDDKPDLVSATQDILSQGETSGADTLTGFIAAWEIE